MRVAWSCNLRSGNSAERVGQHGWGHGAKVDTSFFCPFPPVRTAARRQSNSLAPPAAPRESRVEWVTPVCWADLSRLGVLPYALDFRAVLVDPAGEA